MELTLPYGKEGLRASLPDGRVVQVLKNQLDNYEPNLTPEELIEKAMAAPIGSPSLAELARGKKKILQKFAKRTSRTDHKRRSFTRY